ncbi:MAG: peroxiredoxin family protein, partial [Gaiellaceae bacterium]
MVESPRFPGGRPAVNLRPRIALLLVVVTALLLWKSQLFLVAKPGERALPLRAIAAAQRTPVHLDALLPMVPMGEIRLVPGSPPLVIEYWAPWVRHAALQATQLDSLVGLFAAAGGATPRAVLACFDPFPSVSRYVARLRLRVPVVLDHERELTRSLPCPSLPYTYVIDAAGRIAVAQAGEVDWLAPETRAALASILAEPVPIDTA